MLGHVSPTNIHASKANGTDAINPKSAHKSGAAVAPLPDLLQRFAQRLHQYAASFVNFTRKNPYESTCIAMALLGAAAMTGGAFIAGAAALVGVGAVIAGIGIGSLVVLIWLDSRAGSDQKSAAPDSENRIVIDLDDPDTWVGTAPDSAGDRSPQFETRIDLKPVTTVDAEQDFDNLFAEIGGERAEI